MIIKFSAEPRRRRVVETPSEPTTTPPAVSAPMDPMTRCAHCGAVLDAHFGPRRSCPLRKSVRPTSRFSAVIQEDPQ